MSRSHVYQEGHGRGLGVHMLCPHNPAHVHVPTPSPSVSPTSALPPCSPKPSMLPPPRWSPFLPQHAPPPPHSEPSGLSCQSALARLLVETVPDWANSSEHRLPDLADVLHRNSRLCSPSRRGPQVHSQGLEWGQVVIRSPHSPKEGVHFIRSKAKVGGVGSVGDSPWTCQRVWGTGFGSCSQALLSSRCFVSTMPLYGAPGHSSSRGTTRTDANL